MPMPKYTNYLIVWVSIFSNIDVLLFFQVVSHGWPHLFQHRELRYPDFFHKYRTPHNLSYNLPLPLKNLLYKHCGLCLWISSISIFLSLLPYYQLGCKYFCSFLSVGKRTIRFFFVISIFLTTFLTWFIFLLFLSIIQLGILFLVMLPFRWLLPCLVWNRASSPVSTSKFNIKVWTEFRIVL